MKRTGIELYKWKKHLWATHRRGLDRYGIFVWWRGWVPRFGLSNNVLWFLFWGIRFGKNP